MAKKKRKTHAETTPPEERVQGRRHQRLDSKSPECLWDWWVVCWQLVYLRPKSKWDTPMIRSRTWKCNEMLVKMNLMWQWVVFLFLEHLTLLRNKKCNVRKSHPWDAELQDWAIVLTEKTRQHTRTPARILAKRSHLKVRKQSKTQNLCTSRWILLENPWMVFLLPNVHVLIFDWTRQHRKKSPRYLEPKRFEQINKSKDGTPRHLDSPI